MRYELLKLNMAHPGDVSELEHLLKSEQIQAEHIKGIIAQTEGDGYSRGYSTLAFQVLLSSYLGWSHAEIFDRIPMMMIGKTGGYMSPHYTVFLRSDSKLGELLPGKRFSFGVASSRALRPEEIGTSIQVDIAAEAVRQAIADAGIDSLADVHCVEIKCPWGIGGARSKAASALGSAVALSEVDRERIQEDSINGDHSLYSLRTSVSAGGEQSAVRVIVMGNREGADSSLAIGSGMMNDGFDLPGLYQVFESLGMQVQPVLAGEDQKRIRQVFINAGADALPHIRGQRHTIHSDALSMHSGIVAKAVAHAVVGGVVNDAAILCSAGSEHQGPQGANLIAVVAEVQQAGGAG
ncbi:ring-opening amidohydrolase [Paenibacillus sp. NPDC058071]|uniref:ring-opening amidohydrolase n=1 Tax=Paenibacillus sp. NPDC058071 TaxID=3346326 RepID=UPI0036D7A043